MTDNSSHDDSRPINGLINGTGATTPLFANLDASNSENGPLEIESLCMNCEENGITRLLLTRIPFYKEVILMSFNCDHCGLSNCELQPGSKVQEQGLRLVLRAINLQDLDRQVVKSEYAGITIPELELEIPHHSQTGEVTNVEGILRRVHENLSASQARHDETSAVAIAEFLVKLTSLLTGNTPFTLVLDDPSGNSFIQQLSAPGHVDTQITTIHYHRNLQQEKLLGLVADDFDDPAQTTSGDTKLHDEVLHFSVDCPGCRAPAQSNMKLLNIPQFKQVIIMATVCDACGHRSSEVKSGVGIAPQGARITLTVDNTEDLNRDVLKSETCSMYIPELDFEVGMGTLGGRFTTVEGLLEAIREQLDDQASILFGDSADNQEERKQAMGKFLDRLQQALAVAFPFQFVLDDPAGNSYIQSLMGLEPDKKLSVEYYERTWEQNEELGLNDMKTEEADYTADNETVD